MINDDFLHAEINQYSKSYGDLNAYGILAWAYANFYVSRSIQFQIDFLKKINPFKKEKKIQAQEMNMVPFYFQFHERYYSEIYDY